MMLSLSDLLGTSAGAGGGGVLGALLVWLGLKSKLQDVEKRISSLSKGVRYIDTCNEICKSLNQRLQSMESRQSEMCKDIKLILSKLS